jgi:hypothetical protein
MFISKKEKDWRKERKVAHWILSKTFQFVLNDNISYFILNKQGHANGVNKTSSKTIYYADTQFVISTLINDGKFTASEIYRSINILIGNNHVEPVNEVPTDHYPKTIKGTPEGRNAFENNFYLNQIEERKSDWPKRNWFLADLIKIAIGLALGFLLRIATEPTRNQSQVQKEVFQQLPNNLNTVLKN